MAGYTLNPQPAQDSIEAFLAEEYPHIPQFPDGMVDGEYEEIKHFADGSIQPFFVLWYSDIKRSANGRSFGDYKLDSHYATVDIVVVCRNGGEARTLTNDVNDRLIGFKPTGSGRMHKGTPLWSDARQIMDDKNNPSRWARTARYDFGISHIKVPDPTPAP